MKNTMPDKNDLKALAKWYNETALELIEDVLAKHTATLLAALKEQVQKPADENRALGVALSALETIASSDDRHTGGLPLIARCALETEEIKRLTNPGAGCGMAPDGGYECACGQCE